MKWTTANVKHPNYTENHEIYVGTRTGSLKKFLPAFEEKPFQQTNLQDLSCLEKSSQITSLAFGDKEKSQILIGRGHSTVQLQSLCDGGVVRSFEVEASPVVGLARFGNDYLVAGSATGQVQRISLPPVSEGDAPTPEEPLLLKAGDDMAHLRQCSVQPNLVATGGKGRQNNLKVFDMEVGKQVFTSKNLPNNYLQLEVPVWDSDIGFLDSPNTLATCSRHGYVRFYDTRKQRRPVQCYATEDQMSFTTLAAHGNYIYTGTTMGALKAFDIRRMKNFVHTYKGFTGAVSDLSLDCSGKYLASASLDRYVRIHSVDSCVLLYQCYAKSKVTRVLLRESSVDPNAKCTEKQKCDEKKKKRKYDDDQASSEDEEYNEIFDKMQTVCEYDVDDAEATESQPSKKAIKSAGLKGNSKVNVGKSKKKKS